ncbi:MAG: GrpB family protein [Dermabacter sp.]|nr:GrpB family protein [Dermabacter sp.]
MPIHLSEYTESWVQDFMSVASRLVDALDGHGGQGIEHIGATAVPSMVARPIIDIAVIAAPLALEEATATLAAAGYRPGQQLPDLGARRFHAPADAVLHSLVLCEEDSALLHAHLAVRHVLMNDPVLAAEMAGYKRGLAFTGDIGVEAYAAAKTPMFARVLEAAGMQAAQRSAIAASFAA